MTMAMKAIKVVSALVAVMGCVHMAATFSPLIGGKLAVLDAGTYNAMIYMSLMCGLLLVVLGGYLMWAVARVEACPVLAPSLRVAASLLLVDGVMAMAFMPHNPFAWTIGVLCVAAFLLVIKSK